MSKEILSLELGNSKNTQYSWKLFFFKIDKRKNNLYSVNEIKFRSNSFPNYVNCMIDTILHFQVEPIENVLGYDGFNTKVSCDKLLVSDTLINDNLNKLMLSLQNPSDEKIEGIVHGYMVVGKSPENKNITFIKMGNPVIKLETKKSLTYMCVGTNELDIFQDDICRLYLTTDSIIVNGTMYSFNHNFEKLFNIDNTISKVRDVAVQKIVDTDAFSDLEQAVNLINHYPSSRTFITLKDERLSKISSEEGRRSVCDILELEINTESKFIVDTEEKASNIIKYLCFKRFKEADTNNIIEANGAIAIR